MNVLMDERHDVMMLWCMNVLTYWWNDVMMYECI